MSKGTEQEQHAQQSQQHEEEQARLSPEEAREQRETIESDASRVRQDFGNATKGQHAGELPLHVFGYGSLIWRAPPFKGLKHRPGYITGFARRFSQWSHDHRGTSERPGLVCSLVDGDVWSRHRSEDEPITPEEPVWGVVYTLPKEQAAEIWSYLHHREKDGYSMRVVDVYNEQGEVIERDCAVYVGEESNPSFAGGLKMDHLAAHIHASSGPSGPNKDYLYNLADAVRDLVTRTKGSSPKGDLYLSELERLVKERDATQEQGGKVQPPKPGPQQETDSGADSQ